MSWTCKLLGHRWDGCRCVRCGRTREEGHRYLEAEDRCEHTCEICGKTEAVPHTWYRCRCTRCGEVRNEQHQWLKKTPCERVCKICGQERETHEWRHVDRGLDRCDVCGRTHRLTPEEIARRDEEWSSADVDPEGFDGAPDDLPDQD